MIVNSYSKWVAITKSDTINFDGSDSSATQPHAPAKPCDAIYVGGTGIVVAVAQDGTTCNFTAAVGEILPISAIRVNSTTTTATLMVALYNQ